MEEKEQIWAEAHELNEYLIKDWHHKFMPDDSLIKRIESDGYCFSFTYYLLER